MAKLLIEIPDNLHRLVKTLATAKGETMKNFVIRSMENLAKHEANNENINDVNFLKPHLTNLVDKMSNTISTSK
jgi:hypothetical protein